MKAKPFSDLPLWPDYTKAPQALPDDSTKQEHLMEPTDAIDRLIDVVNPTISFYPATGVGPRPAVLVCPGGGYHILAWNHEGTDIAAWLQANGISAFLLKYRCPGRRAAALADAVRAMRIIRANAAEWNVRPDKVGTIGFSAGSHLSVCLGNLPTPDAAYEPLDAIDASDPRPNFQFVIYPAYLDQGEGPFGLSPELAVSEQTPPTFLFQAEDDTTLVGSSFAYGAALTKLGVPLEMHIVPNGGHGYGMLHHGKASDVWPRWAMEWFQRHVMKTEQW